MKNLGLKVIFCLTVICAVLSLFRALHWRNHLIRMVNWCWAVVFYWKTDNAWMVTWLFLWNSHVGRNSKVDGNVFIAGGSLFVDGEIDGDVVAFGGSITLDDDAVVRGNINTVGASLSRADNAVVEGDIKSGQPEDYNLDIKPP
jgi:hypothetical protein